ncbi:MAG: TIGR03560 family F420-dependent LLM class oxidoreductase [Solirubrobacterales bacterium]|nr:TIGR03560 family F420-dependent LLM class oxidoreductase [Solirubrobacterales bacterium]
MDLSLMIEGQEGVSWEQWVALAHACEQHGIDTLFRSDHYMNLDGQHPERGSLDAWGTLCALAAVTSTVRLGTMVSPATFRHPSELARLATTADRISGGRIELGLGAGWHQREHEAHGFNYHDARTRMDILEEQLQVVLGNWAAGPFDFSGDHYRIQELDAQPKPVQQPHPPLLMGGIAGPRGAALAARYADEYNTVFPTLAEIRERRGRLEAASEKAGRTRPLPLSVMTLVLIGSDQSDLDARIARVAAAQGVSVQDFRANINPAWVVGLVDDALEKLHALAEAGVSRVMCQHLAHDDVEFVELLGRTVAPQLP